MVVMVIRACDVTSLLLCIHTHTHADHMDREVTLDAELKAFLMLVKIE